MKGLFKVLKDHKNPLMEKLVNSSYQYCFRDEFESSVGDADSVDLDECGTENVIRICLVDPSFYFSLSWALRKLQEAKLVIDQFGFQLDSSAVPRGSLVPNESFKAQLLKDMKKVIDILANPHCEVIRPLRRL